MKKHQLYTQYDEGKIFWCIVWGYIDGVELSYDPNTDIYTLMREGAYQSMFRTQALELLKLWKAGAEEHIVVPIGFFKRTMKTMRSKIDGN